MRAASLLAPLALLLALWTGCAAPGVDVPPPPISPEGTIAGVVVDDRGNPVRARVAICRPSGSRSTVTADDGRFEFEDLDDTGWVVTATTEDGRFATLPNVEPGGFELRLPPLAEGASVVVEMRGRERMRVAVLQDGVRVHDYTVRDAQPRTLVVPEGESTVLVYDARRFEERHDLALAAGASARVEVDV